MPILTAQERLGTRIGGRYRVERLLATGGMGVLFEARDLRTHRMVALKLLRSQDCVEERRRARFLQEMRLTAELRHPNVVDVLDLGEDENGIPYLVMELLHGHSLQVELDERGTLGCERALEILLPVMEALASVHDAGVVHRDVKPDNIFLHNDPRGTVVPKLLDFGIAKAADTSLATRTGAVLGTPDYMAPEQVRSGAVGPGADIWAVGAVLYRALSGGTPYHAETSAEVIAKLARDSPPPLRVSGLALPIAAAIDRSLSRAPEDRYADMHAFASALVVCAREAGLAVAHEPAERHGRSEERASERTFTAPSRSIVAPSTLRMRWVATLAGLAAVAIIALFTVRELAHASRSQRAELPLAAQAASAVSTTTAARAVRESPAAEAAANVAHAQVQSPAEHGGAASERPVARAADRKPHDSARRRRSRVAAEPPAATPPSPSFERRAFAGDLPVAVVW